MLILAAGIVALLLGPLIYRGVRHREAMLSLLDGFIFVAIAGLVLFYILPESIGHGGLWAILFALVGIFGPTAMEKLYDRAAHQTHTAALFLGLAGICLHALIDGAALAGSHNEEDLLPLAIVLHRLPVGLTIWWLLRPSFGLRTASSVLILASLMTAGGFFFGPILTAGLSSQGIAWFQALVAGSLFHVVLHQPHREEDDCGCHPVPARTRWYEGSGALIGIALLIFLIGGHSLANHGSGNFSAGVWTTFWALALESAPALLLAYVMAGMMNAFLPRSSIHWMGRGSPWSQSLRGMAVGLPLPICSCGVVPIYRTLIRRGAPAGASMAFLVATPELGLDAILLSIPLLGTDMTLLRVAAAGLVAWLAGSLMGRLMTSTPKTGPAAYSEDETAEQLPFLKRLSGGLRVGLGEVVDHTAPWILIGLMAAAIADPFLRAGWLASLPPALEIPIFALIGLPAYVCASGATPFVAVLLYNGISPGAALAFLLTGPATNVTTFGLLRQLHGRRVAAYFSTIIITLSIGGGYLVNALFPYAGQGMLAELSPETASPFQIICLLALITIYLLSMLRRGARQFVAELRMGSQA